MRIAFTRMQLSLEGEKQFYAFDFSFFTADRQQGAVEMLC